MGLTSWLQGGQQEHASCQGPRSANAASRPAPHPALTSHCSCPSRRQLFPLIDANHDGAVSLGELSHHLYASGMAIAHRRAEAEFTESDANHDGALRVLGLGLGQRM